MFENSSSSLGLGEQKSNKPSLVRKSVQKCLCLIFVRKFVRTNQVASEKAGGEPCGFLRKRRSQKNLPTYPPQTAGPGPGYAGGRASQRVTSPVHTAWRERPRLRRHSWHRMPPRSRTCRAPTRKSTFRTLSATACWPKGASHLKKKRGEVEMGAGCVYSPGNFGSERCDRGLPSCFSNIISC